MADAENEWDHYEPTSGTKDHQSEFVKRFKIAIRPENEPPRVVDREPESDFSLSLKESRTLTIWCRDEDAGDDLTAYWRVTKDGRLVEPIRENDAAISGSEGNDAESFSFSSEGTYLIEAWCKDDHGGGQPSDPVAWNVDVHGPRAPTASRKAPADPTIRWDARLALDLSAELRDADGDLDYAEWYLDGQFVSRDSSPGGSLSDVKTTFTLAPGRHVVDVLVYDSRNDPAQVGKATWTIDAWGIASVEWSKDLALHGEDVSIRIDAHGLQGQPMVIEILEADPAKEEVAFEFSAILDEGLTSVAFRALWTIDFEGDIFHKTALDPEYVAVVRLSGEAHGRSGWLEVERRGGDVLDVEGHPVFVVDPTGKGREERVRLWAAGSLDVFRAHGFKGLSQRVGVVAYDKADFQEPMCDGCGGRYIRFDHPRFPKGAAYVLGGEERSTRHELFHAIQHAYGAALFQAPPWFYEGGARLSEAMDVSGSPPSCRKVDVDFEDWHSDSLHYDAAASFHCFYIRETDGASYRLLHERVAAGATIEEAILAETGRTFAEMKEQWKTWIPEEQDDDSDGVSDARDNCVDVHNPRQEDNDRDNLGDACDPDDDNDGTEDGRDDFPKDASESRDTDADGVGNNADRDDDGDGVDDQEELQRGSDPLRADTDRDGADDGEDNCLLVPNPNQEDADKDDVGDACDGSVVPGAPRDLAANLEGEPPAVALAWRAPESAGTGEVSGYRIWRAAGAEARALLASIGANASFVDREVRSGESYSYAVSAVNEAGEGPASGAVGVQVPAPPPPPAPPTTAFRVENRTAQPGQQVEVPVRIADVIDYGSGTITLAYDPSLARAVDVRAGDMPGAGLEWHVDETAGRVTILVGVSDTPGPSGSFQHVGIVFDVPGGSRGNATLDLTVLELVHSDGSAIESVAHDGRLTVGLRGDANRDGRVSGADALFIRQHVVGKRPASQLDLDAADVNGDGRVTGADALRIAQFVVGKRPSP